jgi:hypothetical protein
MKISIKMEYKIIILQSLGFLLIINGIKRLHVVMYSKIYECFLNSINNNESNNDIIIQNENTLQCLTLNGYNNFSFEQLITHKLYLAIFGLILSISLVTIINWKYKVEFINSLTVLCMIIGISFIAFVSNLKIHVFLNFFGELFTNNLKYSNLITGLIFPIIGILIIILSKKNKSNFR